MKKILLIGNYKPDSGGISGQIYLLNKLINNESGFYAKIFNIKGSVLYRATIFFKLLKVGKQYDVFHIHTCSYAGFLPAIIGVWAGKILKKKIVLTYHGGDAENFFKKRISIVKKILHNTDENIVLSGFLESVFKKYSIPCIIIPNILEFDKNKFNQREVFRPKYVSVRSLNKEYNIQCIVKAFQVVLEQIPQATLIILGDGNCKEELELFIKEQGIQNISFTGKVKNQEIYNYLADADIFLSSPLVDNQPVSILEAYNAGLLVISSNVGGVPYMLEDNKTGYLFESDNFQELADKMKLAINDQEASKKIILEAHQELEKYLWKTIKTKLLEIYSSL